jgi:ketosteroid isomerase-like protein
MNTSETRDVIERMYAAAAAGDMGTLAEVMAPDVVIQEPPFLPYGGCYQGLQEFGGVFGEALKVIDLSRLELQSLTVEDGNAFGVVTVPLVSGEGEARIIEHWTVTDGHVTSGTIYWFDTP